MKKLAVLLVSLFVSTIVIADEKSFYNFSWLDKDKEIYVLQNRRFRKDGNFYVGATGGKTLNGAFIDSYGGTLRAGYFFREDWGIELLYGKNTGSENGTAKGVLEQGTVPYYRKIDSYAGGMVMWAPFYSKINTFNRIFYYDWMFGVGAATITTQDNRLRFENQSDKKLTNENSVGALWNTGFRFYISDSWSLRLDFTGLTYQANKTKKSGGVVSESKSLFSNFDLALGLNYTF